MSDPLPADAGAAPKPGVSVPMLILGILFIVVWLTGATLLGLLKLIVGVMANDSGAASAETHMGLISSLMVGQALTATAGIPAGLAFFMRAARKKLLWAFALLLVSGVVIQILSVRSFFS
jgi:hypothetical protein